jgi:hypothetical protein
VPVLPRRPEIHLFILWSEARTEERRILADLGTHFRILQTIEVEWTAGETFARSLSRMYGTALPPGSDKETHCGSGPFLAVVIEDAHPRYGIRLYRRRPKWRNRSVWDARSRYRQWTGGGHRVHASDSVAEARSNLALIFGKRPEDFRTNGTPAATLRSHKADPVGTDGWSSVEQLLLALETHGGGLVSRHTEDDCEAVIIRTADVWWSEQIAGGRETAPAVRDVRVRDRQIRVRFVEQAPGRIRQMISGMRRLRSSVPSTN